MRIKFEWDAAKADANIRKHGVGFDTATHAFADPFAILQQDRIENGELRWQTLGMAGGFMLLIAHTIHDEEDGIEVIRIISARHADQKRGNTMSKTTDSKMVSMEVDLNNLPPLTEAQMARLETLKNREIDYSDIPPLTDQFFKSGVRNPFFKPVKTSTTVRIDTDVLAWLRRQGRGYQTRINAILREAMMRSLSSD